MISPDVNVLIYAHRAEVPDHAQYAQWLKQTAESPEPFALSELVATAFVRIVTNPRAFAPPTDIADALEFIARLARRTNCRLLRPGPNAYRIFEQLCLTTEARGKVVADAYHASLAIEHGCEWITNDGDFARFENLRWRHALAPEKAFREATNSSG